MHSEALRALQASLHEAGVPATYIRRLVVELGDHFEDLELEARGAGCDPGLAQREALQRLGRPEAITSAVLARPELASWCHRWPWLVSVVKPVLVLLLVPAMPVVACIEHAPALVRWSASISLGSIVTGSLLLLMAQSLISAL